MGEKHTLMIATVVDPGIILLSKGVGTSLTARRGTGAQGWRKGEPGLTQLIGYGIFLIFISSIAQAEY